MMFLDTQPQHWRDAAIGIALYFITLALLDPAPAATTPETPMETAHSTGPYHSIIASPTGYTTIHDDEGRMIGAAVSGQPHLPKATVEANGRLFAASPNLYSALTAYAQAVEAAITNGFNDETMARIDEARIAAKSAFTLMGYPI